MKFRLLAFVALLLLPTLGGRAHAQALYAATAPGAYVAVGSTYSSYQIEYGQRVLGGIAVHADINFTREIGIEAEGRWLRQNQEASANETTYLVGPRYQFRFRHGPIQPYAKVLVGEGIFNFPYNYERGEYFVVAPGAGIELKISEALKIRLIDVEYQRWPQFTYGPITPYGIGFGFTYRIFSGTGTKYRKP